MEPRWLNVVCNCILMTGLTLCLVLDTNPTLAVEIHAPAEVIVENGTTGVLRCSFRSIEMVSSSAIVMWNFQPAGSDSIPVCIFHYNSGRGYPLDELKGRLQFIGDLNKKDASIQILRAQFNDNGTYFCDVKNPPDISGKPSRTELKVVLRESLPQTNTAVIVGAVCGAVIGLILIAVVTCLIIRRHQTRNDYEGCTSMESSVGSPVPRPQKKVGSSVEESRCSSPSAPVQGPVIYAQLDHSSNKTPSSIHKNEPVVYADIRKN